MGKPVGGLWEPFGMRSTPFFQEELRPTAGDEHPISLFVGREAEVRRVVRRIRSDRSSRTIVEGEPGIGKTSFVNRVKAEAAAIGVATHEHPVRVTSDTTRASFVGDVLRALARIRIAGGGASRAGDEFWERTVRRLEGGEMHGGGVSAAGFGASVSRAWVAPAMGGDALYEELGEALSLLRNELSGEVLIHVNNLESVSADASRAAAVLLLDLRDYLLLPGAHWIFVGASGVEDAIFRFYDQVGGIFPAAEALDPLPPSLLEQLLELRYRHLAIGKEYVAPILPADAARLYGLYQGDLRNFLRLLGDAAERGLGIGEIRPMHAPEVSRLVAPDYARRLLRSLGEGDYQHLAAIFEANRKAGGEFRVTDAAQALPISQAAVSQLVGRLVDQRVVRRIGSAGRSIFYRPTGEALVAFGAPIVESPSSS